MAVLAIAVILIAVQLLKPFSFLSSSHCLVIAGLAFGVVIAGLFLLHRADRKRLHALPTSELERRVWCISAEYFDYIGHSHPAVAEFKRIVEARDLVALQRSWPDLQSEFLRLEHAAGTRSRPLIMDYYHDLSDEIAELVRRTAVRCQPSGHKLER